MSENKSKNKFNSGIEFLYILNNAKSKLIQLYVVNQSLKENFKIISVSF